VIHAKAELPVDMRQVAELADALESPEDSPAYKVALLEIEHFGFLFLVEEFALDQDGLRLQTAAFRASHRRPKLATRISEEVNRAPMSLLLRALILKALEDIENELFFELKSETIVVTSRNGAERASIPKILWLPILGWWTRGKAVGWHEIRSRYDDGEELPTEIQIELTDSTIRLAWQGECR
jgi:hypothetical protein